MIVISQKLESIDATEYFLEWHGQFNWINLKNLSAKQQYHKRKIRWSSEIKKSKSKQKKRFESRWRKSRQNKNMDSTLYQANWKRNLHKDMSNLKMSLAASCISFTFENDSDKRRRNIVKLYNSALTVVISISFVIYICTNGDVN